MESVSGSLIDNGYISSGISDYHDYLHGNRYYRQFARM
jgi:hypothetical protein